METAGQNTKQVMEENDALKQLMELLNQQNMNEQSQDFMGVFWYVAGMQVQLSAMVDELQGVREQLSQMQETQPKPVTKNLMEKVSHLQEKITSLSERLTEARNRLVETAAQAVNAFKEKGRTEMCKVLQKGISGVKSMLSGYRERLVDVMTDCEKTANQIDSIGDELKQIGNSVSNVGRLLAGKGGPMSILWTKKVERLCCFFKFLILLLLWCYVTNRTVYSFSVIPAFYVFKDCSVGFL